MKLSSTSFSVNHCHYLMLLNKRQNWWLWAIFSFRPALHDHRVFCCFRFESEEFGYFVGDQGWWSYTLHFSPDPLLIIISNPTALTGFDLWGFNLTNPAWLWRCQYLFLVTYETSHCPVKSRDSRRAGLHLILLSITHSIPHRAQNITKYKQWLHARLQKSVNCQS